MKDTTIWSIICVFQYNCHGLTLFLLNLFPSLAHYHGYQMEHYLTTKCMQQSSPASIVSYWMRNSTADFLLHTGVRIGPEIIHQQGSRGGVKRDTIEQVLEYYAVNFSRNVQVRYYEPLNV